MPRQLDRELLNKISEKLGIQAKSVKNRAAKLASSRGVSSDAALVLMANELGIGTTRVLNRMSPDVRAQVQGSAPLAALIGITAQSPAGGKRPAPSANRKTPGPTEREALRAVIPLILSDKELQRRCGDLLLAAGTFDRVLREATTILEARLRKLTGLGKSHKAHVVVVRALNPTQAILRVSPDDGEQQGFYHLVQGTLSVFRNTTHHELSDSHSRWDALRLCGLVNYILTTLEAAQVIEAEAES